MSDPTNKRCEAPGCTAEPSYLLTQPAIPHGERWSCKAHRPPEWYRADPERKDE